MQAGRIIQKLADGKIFTPASRIFVAAGLSTLAHWDVVLAVACFIIAAGYLSLLLFVTHHIFWDFTVYAGVVKAIVAGVSPYNDTYLATNFGVQTPFRYPPFVADVFYQFRWLFLSPIGQGLLMLTHVAAWLSIPYLLAGSPRRWYSRDYLYVWGLYLVLFGVAGMRLLVVGNMAAALFAVIILSIVYAVQTKDYRPFWIAILICSFFKFYFIVLLLIPIILDKKYVSACLLVCALIALYGLNYFVEPTLFGEYLDELTRISRDGGGVTGWSLYALISSLTNGLLPTDMRLPAIALGFHLAFVITIFIVAFAIKQRRARPQDFDLFCCWLFMSAFLMSPRIFDYEVAMLTVPAVLLARMLLLQSGKGMIVAVVVTALGTLLLRTPVSIQTGLAEWSGIFFIFGVWSGAAVHWLTSKRPRPSSRFMVEMA
jgi:hypothetical protein